MEQPAAEPLPPFATDAELSAFTRNKIKVGPVAQAVLAAVSSEIRKRAGWHIWPLLRGHQLRLDGSGGPLQPIPTMRLVELTSMTNAGVLVPVDVDAVDAVASDSADWSEAGLVRRVDGGHFTSRYRQVRVTMDHGWEDVPELKQLCISLTARALASPMGITREQAGSVSINWAMVRQGVSGGIIPTTEELATVDRYRIQDWS